MTQQGSRQVLATVVVALMAISWIGFIALQIYYGDTRPRLPDEMCGRIYPLNNHGAVVYLTKSEQVALWCLEGGAFTLFVVAASLRRSWGTSGP